MYFRCPSFYSGSVSQDFGAKGDGVTDDTAAIKLVLRSFF